MKHLAKIFAIGILPLLTLVLGWQLGSVHEERNTLREKSRMDYVYSGGTGSGRIAVNPEEEVDLSLLWSVWRLLGKNYIEPEKLQVQTMLHGIVAGAVESLDDPYTVFMTPKENKDFQDSLSGELQGIGAELTQKDDLIVVVAPLNGSPAQKAGLQPEDIITAVDDESTEGKNLTEVVGSIRGPKGSSVKLSVFRQGESDVFTLEIVRDDITVPSTEYEVLETASGSVGYIVLNQFALHSTEELEQALASFEGKNIKGIVLDVRYNGGGYLERAVDVVSMFLSQGNVVSVVRREGEPDVHDVYGNPLDAVTPMAVLINAGSASASEIVAGALQDHGRATIIGKKSFGKGTIQEIFELPGGSSLRMTIAKWLTPNGRDLGKEGVEPDIDVDRTLEDFEADRDPQLAAALEWLLDNQDVSASATREN